MANYDASNDPTSRELEVLKLSVLFDSHFFNGTPTQVHFSPNSGMVGAWIDDQGNSHLSVGLDRIQFMNSDQLAFLIAHEYGHLVLKHPEQTMEIQHQYGISSAFDEFMLSFDLKREYSKLMRDMELQADLFGANLVLGLGRDPVSGASFLLDQAKSIQHPEGTLRVSKIESGLASMVPEDFSGTFNNLPVQVRDAEVLAALEPSHPFVNESTNTPALKAVVESWSQGGHDSTYASDNLYGFEVSVLLTLAVLACALPSWWRKTSVG